MNYNIFFLSSEFFLTNALLVLICSSLFLRVNQITVIIEKISLSSILKLYLQIVLSFAFMIVYINIDMSFYFYGLSFLFDTFTNFAKLIILGISLIITSIVYVDVAKYNKIRFPFNVFEFFPLILFNLIGILAFLSSQTFLTTYITLELQSLTLALLFGFNFTSKYSSESGLKYFIISSFSTALLLLGFGCLYGLYGVINFENLFYLIISDLNFFNSDIHMLTQIEYIFALFALVAICLAFLIKLGVAPFHMWTLDVYEGAPTLITLYALIIPKIAYLIFLLKFYIYIFIDFSSIIHNIFYLTGLLSVIIGSIGALTQVKIKRLLAYSAVANFGYILLALSGNFFFNIFSAIIFLFIYVIVTLSLFLSIMSLTSRIDNCEIKSIFQFSTIVNSGNTLLGFIIALFFFVIASIPPFNLYIAKFLLINVLLINYSIIGSLVVVLISVVSCIYYIRLIRLLYFKNFTNFETFIPFLLITRFNAIIISLVFYLNLFYIVYPNLFINMLIYVLSITSFVY